MTEMLGWRSNFSAVLEREEHGCEPQSGKCPAEQNICFGVWTRATAGIDQSALVSSIDGLISDTKFEAIAASGTRLSF